MDNLKIIALNNLIETKAAKAARAGLSVGTHQVDMLVRVQGTVSVAADTEKVPTVSIPVKEVLALFIARSGATREASLKLLSECLTDALKDGVKGEGAIKAAAEMDKEFEARIKALTAALPKSPVKGAVKTDLTVCEVVETAEMAAK